MNVRIVNLDRGQMIKALNRHGIHVTQRINPFLLRDIYFDMVRGSL